MADMSTADMESPAGCLEGEISPTEEMLTEVIHHGYSSQVTETRRRHHSRIY